MFAVYLICLVIGVGIFFLLGRLSMSIRWVAAILATILLSVVVTVFIARIGDPPVGETENSIACSVALKLDKDAEEEKLSVQSQFVKIAEDSSNGAYTSSREEETWNFLPITLAGDSASGTIGTSNSWAAINITRLPAADAGETAGLYSIEFSSRYDSDVYFEIATNVTLEVGVPLEIKAERTQAELTPNKAMP